MAISGDVEMILARVRSIRNWQYVEKNADDDWGAVWKL